MFEEELVEHAADGMADGMSDVQDFEGGNGEG